MRHEGSPSKKEDLEKTPLSLDNNETLNVSDGEVTGIETLTRREVGEKIEKTRQGIEDAFSPSPLVEKVNISEVLSTIREVNKRLDNDLEDLGGSPYNHFSGKVKENLIPWGQELFRLARESQGKDRCLYAEALEDLYSIVGPRDYNQLLSEVLLTNKETIRELYKKGVEEAGPTSILGRTSLRIKHFLG